MNSQALSKLLGWLCDADDERGWLKGTVIKIQVMALIKKFRQPPTELSFLSF